MPNPSHSDSVFIKRNCGQCEMRFWLAWTSMKWHFRLLLLPPYFTLHFNFNPTQCTINCDLAAINVDWVVWFFFPVFPEILSVKVWSVSIWFVHCVWRSYRRISLNLVIIYGRVCLDQSILFYGNLIRFELDVAFYINAQMHLEFVWGGGDKHADLRNT